ncbi:MAG: aldehyde dehydrogenase family protein [Planctomycetota bacterium]|nr:aldehyde dehydrogenase family protein [Planctomycetota bacterium]
MDTQAEVHRAISQARLAQQSWRSVRVRERAERIARFAGLVVEHRRELSAGVLYPTRGGYLETITAELLPLAQTAQWLGSDADRVLRTRRTSWWSRPMWLGSLRSRVERVPRGLVLILGTWNYPIYLTGSQLLHALVAGNGVLIKPAEGCQQVTRKLAELCVECGVPSDLVQVLDSSLEAGKQAMAFGVDHVVMTGSSGSGRRVLEQAIGHLSSATLELSGCDSVFVLPSADLDRVADLLRFGVRLNGGATCIAPRRVFVLESMLDRFIRKLKQRLDPPGALPWSTWLSASSLGQLEPLVQEAIAQGASMAIPWRQGVRRPQIPDPDGVPKEWVSTGPIVLQGVRPGMSIYGLDIFAPLLSIVPVRDIEQAIAFNDSCRYGLCASIFGLESEAEQLVSRIRAGSILVNDMVVPTADARLPFGGRGESGYGVTRGEEGLLEMTNSQVISFKRGKWLPHSDLPQEGDEQLLDGLLQFQYGRGWKIRMSGLQQVLRSIRSKPTN